MKIELHELPRMSLQAFADQCDLVMVIHEEPRSKYPHWHGDRVYLARFKGCSARQDQLLVPCYGMRETKELAMRDYAEKISNLTLEIGDGLKVQVPILAYDPEEAK
jgi:hypothetical protein